MKKNESSRLTKLLSDFSPLVKTLVVLWIILTIVAFCVNTTVGWGMLIAGYIIRPRRYPRSSFPGNNGVDPF